MGPGVVGCEWVWLVGWRRNMQVVGAAGHFGGRCRASEEGKLMLDV